MFKKIKEILKSTFISTFCYTFTLTIFVLVLIVNNDNILTGGSGSKNERELLQIEGL